MWQQGNRDQALDWLANLNPQQQQSLQRAMRTHQAFGPIYDAANRVHQVASHTTERLSESAQRLASRATQFGQNAAARAGEIRQNTTSRVTEFGQQAAGVAQRGRDATVGAAQRAVVAADARAQQAIDGVNVAGRAVAGTATNAGRAVAGTATNASRAVADAGRQVAGNVSRWFQEKRSNATNRADAARAAFAAFRQDPTLQQTGMSGKDVVAMSQQFSRVLTSQTPEQLVANAGEIYRAAQEIAAKNQAAQQQAQPGTGGQHRDGNQTRENAAWALSGTPPPIGAVTQKPAAAGQGQQGEQASTSHNNHRKPDGPER
jgi:hypothetical protein